MDNNFKKIQEAISRERLETFEGTNDLETVSNYVWNAKLSESFYFVLSNLEVTLRNAIYNSYNLHYNEPFFYLFVDNSNERYVKKKEFHSRTCWKMLCGARHNLLMKNKPVTDSRLIAELNFGFWSQMIHTNHPKYKNMWRYIFKDVFPHFPLNISNDKAIIMLGGTINQLRIFRNRLFHYEPILNYDLEKIHESIINITNWISPDINNLSIEFDEYEKNIFSKDSIKRKIDRMYRRYS